MAKNPQKHSNAGRKTLYDQKFNDQVYKLCLLGAIDTEIADFFDIAVSTLNNWKIEYPEFLESIKKGKVIANGEVANSLYKRANGYSHPEDKIFNDNGTALVIPTVKHYPPDTGACMAFLKNRTKNQKDPWTDKHETDLTSKGEKINDTVKFYIPDNGRSGN